MDQNPPDTNQPPGLNPSAGQDGTPVGVPSFQLQLLPNANPQHQVSNVQTLIESARDFASQGNGAEEKVALQIILISSAILAIISGVGIAKDSISLPIAATILLIFSVLGLGVSLIAGVVHFVTERDFWYKNQRKASDALNLIEKMVDPEEKERTAFQALSDTNPNSNRAAFWIQILSFSIGSVSLIILIIAGIISKA